MRVKRRAELDNVETSENRPYLEVFKHELFGKLRAIVIDGEPWYIGRDVAKALGYENPIGAVKRHCKYGRKLNDFNISKSLMSKSLNFMVSPWVIKEGDVYRLITGSKLPNAQKFADWFYDEVLPALRRDGSYSLVEEKEFSFEDILPELKAAAGLARFFGYKGNQAKLAAVRAVKENYGVDLTKVIPPMLPSPIQTLRVTPTEVGRELGVSAKKANRILQAAGFQIPTRGVPDEHHRHGRILWQLTEAGEEYGEYLDIGKSYSDGTPIQQIRWYKNVVPVLQQKLEQGMEVEPSVSKSRKFLAIVGGKRHEKTVG